MLKNWNTESSRCITEDKYRCYKSLFFQQNISDFYASQPSTFGSISGSGSVAQNNRILFSLWTVFMESLKNQNIALMKKETRNVHTNEEDVDHLQQQAYQALQLEPEDSEPEDDMPSLVAPESDQESDKENNKRKKKDNHDSDDDSTNKSNKKNKGKKQNKKNKTKKQLKKRNNGIIPRSLPMDDDEGADPIYLDATGKKRGLEIFWEAIADDTYTPKTNQVPKKIVGYRWVVNIFRKNLDPNEVWANLINNIISHNENKINGNSINQDSNARKYSSRSTMQPWECYKELFTKKQLANMCDGYIKKKILENRLEDVEKFPLNNENNPLCATTLFSCTFALFATDTYCYKRQGIYNINYYLRKEESTAIYQMRFPCRKLTYNVSMDDIKPVILHHKLLPHMEVQNNTFMIEIIPLLLNDHNFFEDTSDNSNESDHTINQDRLQRREDVDPERVIKENEKMDIFESVLLESNINLGKVKEAKKFKARDAYDAGFIAQILNIREIKDSLSSAYAPIYVETRRSMEKLKELWAHRNEHSLLKDLTNLRRDCRIIYITIRDAAIKSYKTTCRSPNNPALSPTMKVILSYIEETNLYSINKECEEKTDISLTVPAFWECNFYFELLKIYELISGFNVASLAYKNRLDAFAVHFNRVHNHMILASEKGCVGKSYCWWLLMNCFSILRTHVILNYESAKSRATEEPNQCDLVCVYDEVQKSLLDKSGNGGNDQERNWKQILSNNKVEVKVLYINPETGKRETKTTYSESINVYLCSMNLSFDYMSAAMRRRFHCITMNEDPHERTSILEMKVSSNATGSSNRGGYTVKKNEVHKMLQALVAETEKVIHSGGLSEVSMDVGNIVLLYVANELVSMGYPEPNPTMYERIMTTARLNCIMGSIQKVFRFKGGIHSEKEIEIEYLTALDPFLFCSLQDIISAIGESIDLIIDPLESCIKMALRKLFNDTENDQVKFKRITRDRRSLVLLNDFDNSDNKSNEEMKNVNNNSEKSTSNNIFAQNNTNPINKSNEMPRISIWKTRAQQHENNQKESDDTERGIIFTVADYVRFSLKGNIKNSLAKQIFQIILQLPDAPLKPSESAILQRLEALSSQSFEPYGYEFGRTSEGKKAEPEHIKISTQERKPRIQKASWDDTAFYVHWEYLFPAQSLEKEDYKEQLKNLREGEQMAATLEDFDRDNIRYIPVQNKILEKFHSKTPDKIFDAKNKKTYSSAYDMEKRYRDEEAEEGGERVVEKIIRDLLSKRGQLAGKYTFTVNRKAEFLRKIIEVDDSESDAPRLMIPIVNSISKIDCKMMKGISKYLDASDSSNYWNIDIDLDSYGCSQRRNVIFLTEAPIHEDVLKNNPLNELIDKRKKKIRKPEDVSQSSIILPPNIQENKTQDIDVPIQEEYNQYEMSKMDDYHHDVINASNDQDIEDDSDERVILDSNDDDYRAEIGYFLGCAIDELYHDDSQAIDNITREGILEIITKIDAHDEDDIFNDVDFDVQRYILSYLEVEERWLYHWDELARAKGITVEKWVELKNEQELDEKSSVFVYVNNEEYKNEKIRNFFLKLNVRNYKMCYMHPVIYNDFENRKFYNDDIHLADKNSYPKIWQTEGMSIVNRITRWKDSKEKGSSRVTDEEIYKQSGNILSFGVKVVKDASGRDVIMKDDYTKEKLMYNIFSTSSTESTKNFSKSKTKIKYQKHNIVPRSLNIETLETRDLEEELEKKESNKRKHKEITNHKKEEKQKQQKQKQKQQEDDDDDVFYNSDNEIRT